MLGPAAPRQHRQHLVIPLESRAIAAAVFFLVEICAAVPRESVQVAGAVAVKSEEERGLALVVFAHERQRLGAEGEVGLSENVISRLYLRLQVNWVVER